MLEEVWAKVGEAAMAVPTKASEMVDLMSRNAFPVKTYVRGKLSELVASFAKGEGEPHFISNRSGAVAGVILSINDLRRVVEILESIEQVRSVEEERLVALAEQRAASPVVAGLDQVMTRYGVTPERLKQVISDLEFD